MRRGQVVLARGERGAMTKARPCVVVQRDVSLVNAIKITVCPLTSTLQTETNVRPFVAPSQANGLRRASQVEVDWIATEAADRFGPIIGTLDGDTMLDIDRALRRWLGL